jgi:hypothetical protein
VADQLARVVVGLTNERRVKFWPVQKRIRISSGTIIKEALAHEPPESD